MNNNEKLHQKIKRYADLAVTVGVNIQPEQELVISSPIECAEFARMLATSAYEHGAREVIVLWNDEKFSKIKYTHSPISVFENVPDWVAGSKNYYADRKIAYIGISASDPEIFKDVESAKLDANTKAMYKAVKPWNDSFDKGNIAWNVISVPTVAWAKKVFPEVSTEQAIDKLWAAIFTTVRLDTADEKQAWADHKDSLLAKSTFLNKKQFVSLRYTNSIGTDVTVGLPQNHVWEGGGDITPLGVYYFPNMPTEEVFTMPDCDRVDGIIVSSMPLNFQGTLITEFSLTFKDGNVVDFAAKTGYTALKRLIKTDDGSKMLGEVALVPHNSPISNMNILFYNTLFDENASCHFALGSAYPSTIKGGVEMTKEERRKLGGNDSIMHVDFMIGTADLSIIATDKNGEQTVIFKDGNWAI